MYLLRYLFRKKFTFKDYEKAEVDPDPIIEKRKATLKNINCTLRKKLMDDLLFNLASAREEPFCQHDSKE